MLNTATALSTLSAVAYAALAASGIFLWRRTRSLAPALVALGFALPLADQLAVLLQDIQFNLLLRRYPNGDTFFIIHHHFILGCVALAGLFAAAIGLVWHAAQIAKPQRVS